MKNVISFHTIRTILFSSLLAVGLLVVGCDSGGSNGDGDSMSGAVTAEVDGGESTGSLSIEFAYATGDETCRKFAFDESFETPGDKEFDPNVIPGAQGCSVDNPEDWDRVEAAFSPDGSADGLTLTLTSGGSEIGSSSSPDASGNLVVEVGSVDDN